MKQHTDKIFTDTSHLTEDVLRNYNSDSLSAAEKHLAEKHLVECDLCSHALSGMLLVSNPAVVADLRNDVRHLVHPVNSVPQKSFLKKNFSYFLSGVYVLVALVVYFTFMYDGNKSSSLDPKNLTTLTSPTNERKTSEPVANPDLLLKPENNTAKNIPDVSSKNKIPVQPFAARNEPPVMAKLSSLDAYVKSSANDQGQNISFNHPKVFFNTYFLLNLKVIDYSKIYTDEKFDDFNKGVPAPYENSDQKNKPGDAQTKFYSYEQVLENALSKMNAGKCEESKELFNVILQYFPDDLNAKFYGALSDFRNRNFDQAKIIFTKLSSKENHSFFEESQWYLALTLEQQKNIPDAKKMLEEIKNGKGFYSRQVEEKLKALK